MVNPSSSFLHCPLNLGVTTLAFGFVAFLLPLPRPGALRPPPQPSPRPRPASPPRPAVALVPVVVSVMIRYYLIKLLTIDNLNEMLKQLY